MPTCGRPTILFLSELSDSTWPNALATAFPHHRIATSLADAAPEETVAAIVWKHPHGSLSSFRNLKVIVNLGAGVDHIIGDHSLPPDVPIVRLVDPGLTSIMREYVLTHCLSLHRRLAEMRAAQAARRWQFVPPSPTGNTCIGILGFGRLGRTCADLLSHVGFEVIGWKRSPASGNEYDVYYGAPGLNSVFSRAEIIVVLLPLTEETRDLLGRDEFRRMRRGTALVNVGRGELVVEEDLLVALEEGQLRHAVLDVFRTEPLGDEHPFWIHSNITITPHNAAVANPVTALEQVTQNLQCAFSGEPLSNLVDPARGY